MFCFSCLGGGAALITSSIYHYCVVRENEFSTKVEMSKVQSFYWNKLSKSFFLILSSFLFVFCFSCLGGGGGAALITSSIYHYCVVREKEFSRKVEMSKVESFY